VKFSITVPYYAKQAFFAREWLSRQVLPLEERPSNPEKSVYRKVGTLPIQLGSLSDNAVLRQLGGEMKNN
jgi:hypothetical protein